MSVSNEGAAVLLFLPNYGESLAILLLKLLLHVLLENQEYFAGA